MSVRITVHPVDADPNRCQLSVFRDGASELYDTPWMSKNLSKAQLVSAMLSISREDLARTFLQAVLRQQQHQEFIPRDEAVLLFRY